MKTFSQAMYNENLEVHTKRKKTKMKRITWWLKLTEIKKSKFLINDKNARDSDNNNG